MRPYFIITVLTATVNHLLSLLQCPNTCRLCLSATVKHSSLLTAACSLGIVSISDSHRLASTFYTAAARAGGGVVTMNFNATPGGASSLVFGPPPPTIQWSQEVLPYPFKINEEFHSSVFDLSVCGTNIMGGSGSQYPALIDTGAHWHFVCCIPCLLCCDLCVLHSLFVVL